MLAYCLITKDSSEQLYHALKSINSPTNNIYINDTGSTDITVDLVKKLKCNLIETKWSDSFAAARNALLPAINNRKDIDHWMWIDSDDEVVYDIDKCLMLEDDVSYLVKLVDAYTKEECWQLRILANAPEIHFVNRVHEEPLNVSRVEKLSGIKVIHYGYINEEIKLAKHKRNLKLMELDKATRGLEAHYWYIRGVAERETGDIKNSLSSFATAYRLSDDPVSKARICYERAIMFKDVGTQLEWLRQGLSHYDLIEIELMIAELDITDRKRLVESVLSKLNSESVFPINIAAIKERCRRLI